MDILSDDDLIQAIKAKIQWHSDQAKKYTSIIHQLQETKTESKQQQTLFEAKPTSIDFTGLVTGRSDKFSDIILEFFNDNIPKTSRQLLDMYMGETGKDMTMPNFSSRLINMRNQGKIRTHVFPDNSHSTKNYFGKTEWFNGNHLIPEYLIKIENMNEK